MVRDAHYYEEKAEEFKLAGDAEGVAEAFYQAAVHDRYLRSQRQHYSGYLFALHYLEGIGADDLRAAHLAYGELYRDEEVLPPVGAYKHEKIRIGYLAPRFVESSAMRFAEPLMLGLDRDKFEVFAFSVGEEEDSFTVRLKENLDRQGAGEHYFCLYGLSLEEGALAVREKEIDILFDLGGHSEGGQTLMIMAKKPAPVQLSGLGYFDTLGLPEGLVDGFLADEVLLAAFPPAAGSGLSTHSCHEKFPCRTRFKEVSGRGGLRRGAEHAEDNGFSLEGLGTDFAGCAGEQVAYQGCAAKIGTHRAA